MKVQLEKWRPLIEYKVAMGATDQEIGELLGISTATANVWRRRLGIPCSEKWVKHMRQEYGRDAVLLLERLFLDKRSLSDIGRRFGVSRQTVLQWRNAHFARLGRRQKKGSV